MAPNAQLQQYINQNLANGVPPSVVAQNLIQNGWREKDILPYLPSVGKQAAANSGRGMRQLLSRWGNTLPSLLLRFGLAFVFIYAAIFVSANLKTGSQYIPDYVAAIIVRFISLQIFLFLFGAFEILLALWLLSGKQQRYAGIVAGLTLMSFTFLNLWDFHVLFRNIAIICAAFTLAALP